MSTPTLVNPAITEFAAAVRAALSDLPDDEVEELTDGLEADLAERLADDGGEPGDPVAYAEELRAAAGLPHRETASTRPSVFAELRAMPSSLRREVHTLAARHPSIDQAWRFLVSVRPVWWILRAVVVTWILLELARGYVFAPISGPAVLLFVVLAVISVQFGRGKWLPFAWMRGVLLAGNVLLAIATPFLLAGAATSLNNQAYAEMYSDQATSVDSSSGLQSNGNQVSNVFAYDAQGTLLKNVQLFDQDGNPLDLVGDPTLGSGDVTGSDGSQVSLVPNQGVAGRLGWNVYPLAHVNPADISGTGRVARGVTPSPAQPPFVTVTPLADPSTITAGPTPTSTPTPASTPGPMPAPTQSVTTAP